MRKGRYYIPMILITPQDRMKKVTNNCLCIFQPSRCGVVAVTDLHEDDKRTVSSTEKPCTGEVRGFGV
jgi:hypothetical protein